MKRGILAQRGGGSGTQLGPWRPGRQWRRGGIPPRLWPWLFDPGSLTASLRRACAGRLRVEVLRQGLGRPRRDECLALGIPCHARALIRQVYLRCEGEPWVYARTVIPLSSLRGRLRRLRHLGVQPLGALLFADPAMTREPVAVARIEPGSRLHALALADSPPHAGCLWARRTCYRLSGHPLLVSEFFLPALPDHPTAAAQNARCRPA